MSALGSQVRGLFVEPRPRVAAVVPVRAFPAMPSVVVLGTPAHGRVVAAGIAVALARALGIPAGLAGAIGAGPITPAALAVAPAARRAAARLRRQGHDASARGRLVWLADRRAATGLRAFADDPVGTAGASCAELARAAAAIRAPSALALPSPRSEGLDRVLAWHDGIVVVREPDATEGLTDLVLASVAALGPPVACVEAPSRVAGTVALLGVVPPAFAVRAVEQLGIAPPARPAR